MERARTLHRALLAVSLLLLTTCGAPGAAVASGQPGAHPTATLPAKWNGVDPRTGMPTVTPPASLAPRPLPAFSDPRVAYIGPDSLLHVVSLDGKVNLAGTPSPLAGYPQDGTWAAGTSPDGRQLAYYEHSQVTIIDAASGVRSTADMKGVGDSEISWSPGQRYIALRGFGDVLCVNVATQTTFYTPQDTSALGKLPMMDGLYGWIDATHVAIVQFPDRSGTPGTHGLATPAPSAGTSVTLASLDVATNQVRPIATLRGYGNMGAFSVLPGGRWTLFVDEQNEQAPITPFTPLAALIDNATGAVTPLHHLSPLLAPVILYSLLWRPGTTQAIVAGEFGPGKSLYLLIDALHDTATSISLPGVPVAWSPDGSTLVIASSPQGVNEGVSGWNDIGAVGAGPFTLTAMRVGMNGSVSAGVTLTTSAMDLPLLGFVHTA
ncbi:MAG TPA: hypothetical protein VGF38_22605 [Ktedonobacterales bacterium]